MIIFGFSQFVFGGELKEKYLFACQRDNDQMNEVFIISLHEKEEDCYVYVLGCGNAFMRTVSMDDFKKGRISSPQYSRGVLSFYINDETLLVESVVFSNIKFSLEINIEKSDDIFIGNGRLSQRHKKGEYICFAEESLINDCDSYVILSCV